MDESRKKRVTQNGKGVKKRGEGLGTGPVGREDGYENRPMDDDDKGIVDVVQTVSEISHAKPGNKPGSANPAAGLFPQGGSGTQMVRMSRKNMIFLIIAAIVIVIILAILLKNMNPGGENAGGGLSGLFGGFTGGSSGSSTWDEGTNNTGKLNTEVASAARSRYTTILGNGEDTVTIMVFTCGTDLESRAGMASNDIAEMCAATLSDKVNILIYTGGCKQWKTSGISNKQTLSTPKNAVLTAMFDCSSSPL